MRWKRGRINIYGKMSITVDKNHIKNLVNFVINLLGISE